MEKPPKERAAIERILQAWGLPALDQPGVLAAMAALIEDHRHFMEILRACEPDLRRECYEALRPYLRFTPKTLDEYVAMSAQSAEAAQLPTLDPAGGLRPFAPPVIEMPVLEAELWLRCRQCGGEAVYFGERMADAIAQARHAGWAYDEFLTRHYCPECLDAMDEETGQETAE